MLCQSFKQSTLSTGKCERNMNCSLEPQPQAWPMIPSDFCQAPGNSSFNFDIKHLIMSVKVKLPSCLVIHRWLSEIIPSAVCSDPALYIKGFPAGSESKCNNQSKQPGVGFKLHAPWKKHFSYLPKPNFVQILAKHAAVFQRRYFCTYIYGVGRCLATDICGSWW